MESLFISDSTLRQAGEKMPLSFREMIELSKLIDQLDVSAIELNPILRPKVDSLLVKSIASAVRTACVAVPVQLNAESVRMTAEALKESRNCRVQVCAPVSSVQMEYICHMKPAALKKAVLDSIGWCRDAGLHVEFVAQDATRGDARFLREIARDVIEAGAEIFTLCDSAGGMLPEEMAEFIQSLRMDVPSLGQVTLGFSGSNDLSLADACTIAAVRCGVREVKAASYALDQASLPHVARILETKGTAFGVRCGVNIPQLQRITSQIETLCRAAGGRAFPIDRNHTQQEGAPSLTAQDSRDAVLGATRTLGYDLNPEDAEKVWNVFQSVIEKKEAITLHELDGIIAAEAMQVPPVYTDVRYVVNTGNTVGAMAHMKLKYHDRELEGLAHGDGVIDAAFQSIEQATGRHAELDDFQVQAVAEGHEAMGETLVKLRSEGRLYSGRGISTDIVGASVMAYINALNKIAYEEETV